MLSKVRGLIACCFPTVNYYLPLTENLPAGVFMHLTPHFVRSRWMEAARPPGVVPSPYKRACLQEAMNV